MSKKELTFTVTEDSDGSSVKTFLRKRCMLSARTLNKLKRSELGILRNGSQVIATDILHLGDTVLLTLPPDCNSIPPVDIDFRILYEDDYILVADKSYNMPVHPTKTHQLDTLANAVSYYMNKRGECYTFRAVNRLDKDTSGCVIIAKDRYCAAVMPQFVKKEYIAVCQGETEHSGTIDEPIKLCDNSKIVRTVSPYGAVAVTHYERIATNGTLSMLKLWLDTGRTHQIRCHLSYIGHPLAGDDLYGGSKKLIGRQALHCSKVSFTHPISGQNITVFSEAPKEFYDLLKGKEQIL